MYCGTASHRWAVIEGSLEFFRMGNVVSSRLGEEPTRPCVVQRLFFALWKSTSCLNDALKVSKSNLKNRCSAPSHGDEEFFAFNPQIYSLLTHSRNAGPPAPSTDEFQIALELANWLTVPIFAYWHLSSIRESTQLFPSFDLGFHRSATDENHGCPTPTSIESDAPRLGSRPCECPYKCQAP